jgi:hypothetical protein
MLILTAAGVAIALCFAGMALLGDLRQQVVPFLMLYGLAYVAYAAAVWGLLRRPDGRRGLILIVALAVLFRLILLLTSPPTLSTDVYRYIWDGRLGSAGVNPYAHIVDSPMLDRFHSPQRDLVNHSWMASPYLPAAQVYFTVVYSLAPDNPIAFQVAAIILDLLTGAFVIDLLRRLDLPPVRSLIYLWNPLVIVEFAHGAHVDALMILPMMVALWALVVTHSRTLSAMALAAATLTKGLLALLLPVVIRRWRWRHVVVYAGLLIAACAPFAREAGWGLVGPLDGEGLFGALRIYASQWNYNGGIYHWLEVLLSGHHTPGAVPPDVAGPTPIIVAKSIMAVALGLVLVFAWRKGRNELDGLSLLRLALVPLTAYLLLTTTVHPWYVTLIVPLLPFLSSRPGSASAAERFLLPGIFFSAAVALSYLTYVDPDNLREYTLVRMLEYIPLYAALAWAARPAIAGVGETGTG